MTTLTPDTSHPVYARVAGAIFLIYIVAGTTSLALAGQANMTNVLGLLTFFSALVLGVTLYRITREQLPARPKVWLLIKGSTMPTARSVAL